MQVIAESKDAFVLEEEDQFFLVSKNALENERYDDKCHPQLRTIGTFVSCLNGRHQTVFYSSNYAAKIKQAIEERSVMNTGSVYPPDYFYDEQNRLFD